MQVRLFLNISWLYVSLSYNLLNLQSQFLAFRWRTLSLITDGFWGRMSEAQATEVIVGGCSGLRYRIPVASPLRWFPWPTSTATPSPRLFLYFPPTLFRGKWVMSEQAVRECVLKDLFQMHTCRRCTYLHFHIRSVSVRNVYSPSRCIVLEFPFANNVNNQSKKKLLHTVHSIYFFLPTAIH